MDTYSSLLRKFSHLLKDQDPLKVRRTWYRYGNGGYLHGDRHCKKHVHVRIVESTALESIRHKTCVKCWHKPLENILGHLACLRSLASTNDKLEYVRKVSLDSNVTVERLGKCLHALDLAKLKIDSLQEDSYVDLTELIDDCHKARALVHAYAQALLQNMPSMAVTGTMIQHKNGISADELVRVLGHADGIPTDTMERMHYAWCSARVLSRKAATQAAREVFDKYHRHGTHLAGAGGTIDAEDTTSNPENLADFWETIYLDHMQENSLRPYMLTGLRHPIVSDKVAGTFYMYDAKYGKNRQTSVCAVPPSVGRWLSHSTYSDKVIVVEDIVEVNPQCLDIVAAVWEPLETGGVYSNLRDTYSAGCRV